MEAVRRPHRAVACAWLAAALLTGLAATGLRVSAQEPATPLTIFRSSRDVISIDVVVRNRSGAIVSDLTAADFEIREDGRPQDVLTTRFEQTAASAPGETVPALQRLGLPPVSSATPTTATDVSGRRLLLLLFDLSGMEPEEVQRGVQAALQFVDAQMTNADLVAVATLTWQLTVLTDFTGDREAVRRSLESMVAVDVSTGAPDGLDAAVDAAVDAGSGVTAVAATDARLRAVRLMADALAPIPQKKALLYFTAGLANAAQDTPAELRLALTSASRANLAIYPVDTRGLQAVIPSGPARVASRSGEGLFSGRDVNDQFTELATSQDTMASMASATGGRMFSGSNDVSAAFARVQQDTAAYYLLGYSSTNTLRDGRFRRVQVRVRREGLRVEARAGYYAERDFEHTSRTDREAQLEEHLLTPDVSAFEVGASARWSRASDGTYRIPVTITVRVPATSTSGDTVDLLAVVEDEDGRSLARVRDAITVPAEADKGDRLSYTTMLTLPSGHFTIRAVARENRAGEMGAVRTELRVPDLGAQSLALGPTWFSLAESSAAGRLSVEVYDAQRTAMSAIPLVATTTLFVNDVQVFEGRMTPSRPLAVVGGGTDIYQTTLPAGVLPAGRYRCQTTIVDPASGRFAILRNDIDIP